MNSYTKFNDAWCIRTADDVKEGDRIVVSRKSGEEKAETLGARISSDSQGTVIFAIARAVPGERVTTQLGGDVAPILGLFELAAKHLKHPAIVIARRSGDGNIRVIRLTVAGAKARQPGTLNVLSGDRDDAGERDWFGRILRTGAFEASPRASAADLDGLVPMLQAFAANPAGEAKRSSRLTGLCCFCNQALKDERSTAVGYGRTCAGHYGLPWGAEKTDLPALLSTEEPDLDAAFHQDQAWEAN